ncbi:MAG TPA: TetR/AcrR family transcriptional regulator [Gaiellaceae bacterium]|nr:TetR/AcrR family transcriptional regulator [Gaiellaceae bacterium]
MSEHSLVSALTETKPTLRRRIIEAADALIREHGLAGATTREIARAAGCAEGSIYVHFEDKIDLIVAVVVEREPFFAALLELPEKAGEASLEENLVPWAEELLALVRDNQPIFLALMGDRAVFERFKARLRERRTGLPAVLQAASDYVRAEQELGRIERRVRPEVVASILVGACRDHVFAGVFAQDRHSSEGFAQALVRTVVFGLGPASARERVSSNLEEETP